MGGSLTDTEIEELQFYGMKYFVEGGTYMADTTRLVSPHFEHVYSIEIHSGLYNDAIEKCKEYSNITLIYGDTIEQFGPLSKLLGKDMVVFLDSHISGYDSGWNGKIRVPVYEELDVILPNVTGKCIFIVDDIRLYKDKVFDWAHLSTKGILEKFKEHNIPVNAYYEKNDRLYVVTG